MTDYHNLREQYDATLKELAPLKEKSEQPYHEEVDTKVLQRDNEVQSDPEMLQVSTGHR